MSSDSVAGAIAQPHRGHLAATILRRTGAFIASLLVTFLGLTAVTFFISRLTKIDPVLSMVGDKASKAAYDNAYKALGLDRSLFVQYAIYVKRLLSGDFGIEAQGDIAQRTIYLLDPQGNLMMRYKQGTEPAGMRKDLERLLKYSKD